MANESISANDVKVTLGATTILGMGTWTWSGFGRDTIEGSEFGDTMSDYYWAGAMHAGTISFNGNYKKDDTTGQDIIRSFMISGSELTSIRFYVDTVSYYSPNDTTAIGGGLAADTAITHVKVTAISGPDYSLGALGKISFTVQCCGHMRMN